MKDHKNFQAADDNTIEQVLAQISAELQLSSQTEQELLEEIRGHLEDALDEALTQGQDPIQALREAGERFGVELVGPALQDEHGPWESADAIVACILPVAGALILRWLTFVPAGSASNFRPQTGAISCYNQFFGW